MTAGLIASGLLIVAAAFTGLGSRIYADAHPEDPSKRWALEACFGVDDNLARYFAADRAACYAREQAGGDQRRQASLALAPAIAPTANFVDLWHAAGHGRLSKDDIRSQQENTRFLRLRQGPR